MNEDLLPDLLAAVDQQITSPQTPYVGKTLARLVKQGVDEQEARTQIAICLGEEMDLMMKKKRSFDENSYKAALDELPMEVDEVESEDEAGDLAP